MNKTINYTLVEERKNFLYDGFLRLMRAFAGIPRTLLEVFTRRNFGERYFRLSSALLLAIVLAVYPYFDGFFSGTPLTRAADAYAGRMGLAEDKPFINEYLFWYLFLIAYVYMSVTHYLDKRRATSKFDFTRYSRANGKVHSIFYKIKVPFIPTTLRNIECFFEPLAFFVIGFAFYIIGQKLGVLLMVSSIFYGFSYVSSYRFGDDYILDLIDDWICQKHMQKNFVDGFETQETDGFIFRGQVPKDSNLRRTMLPTIVGHDVAFAVE